MDFKDYYGILGVSRDASSNEIRKARFRLAHLYHPDKNPGDEGCRHKFVELQEAYEVLKDDEKRKKYDKLLRERESGRKWFDIESFRSEDEHHRTFSSFDNMFSDFFSFFFSDPDDRDSGDQDDVHYDDLLK